MKHFLLLLFFTTNTIIAQGITVAGAIVDSENNEPILYANILLLKTDSSFVLGTTSDEKGKFELKNIAEPGDYIMKISYIGFAETYLNINQLKKHIDVGVIKLHPFVNALDAVIVRADRVIQKADRQILIPTLSQQTISDNGIDLLSRMNLSGINVDILQQTVSQIGGKGVQLRVNGRKVEMQELIAIRPTEVLRIDYYNEPGIRYADDQNISGVIDIILKQKTSGGFVAFDATNALTTGFANGQLTSRFNYKKSEFSTFYKLNYRSYTKMRIWGKDSYHYPEKTVVRTLEGTNAPFSYTYHTISLGYNYKSEDKTFLSITMSDDIRNRDANERNNISTNTSINSKSEESIVLQFNAPSLDVYVQQKLNNNQQIYLNLVGTYICSESAYDYINQSESYTLASIHNQVRGRKYSLIGEAIYEKNIATSVFQAGVRHSQSSTNNKYLQSDFTQALMNQSNTYLFTEWNGKVQHLSYGIGLSGSRIWIKEGNSESINYFFQPLVRLGYSINDHWGMKYIFRLRPVTPSLGNLNNVILSVDEFTDKQGNPSLKPYSRYYNSFDVYYKNDLISTSILFKYTHAKNPIMQKIVFNESSGRFIKTVDNQKQFNNFNIQAEGALRFPENWGSISAVAGYSNYQSIGKSYHHSFNDFYLYMQLQLQYKKMNLSITSMIDRYRELYGEIIDFDEKNTRIVLKYKNNSFSVGAGILNPLGGGLWQTSSKNLSAVINSTSQSFIDDNVNMLFLNVSYNFSFGRKAASKSQRLKNTDIDPGIMEVK